MSSDSRSKTADLRLKEELATRLHEEVVVQSKLTVAYNQCVAERLGLNATDNRCLDLLIKAALGETGPMTPGDLAKAAQLTTGAVTGVIDRLEQAGFVRREHDSEDRRRIIIRPLLERIHRDLEPIWDWMTRSFSESCAGYSPEELRLLIDFTHRTQNLLREATLRLQALEVVPTPRV